MESKIYHTLIFLPSSPEHPRRGPLASRRLKRAYRQARYCKIGQKLNDEKGIFTIVMEGTHLPLRTWLMAFSLMCSAKKGISALQLQRDLHIGSYKTAWRMFKQVRKAMSNIEYGKTFEAIMKIDETYIGGQATQKEPKG